ncbi:MAG: hypothetical protein HYR60_09065 [Acidobacteria bacterium]|nr:hypothetical protein [Acidobacteriota bacterium]
MKVLSLFGIKPLAEEAALAALSRQEIHGRPYSFSATRGGYPKKLRPVLVLPRVSAAADPLFCRIDRDLDGRLSADEINHAPDVLRDVDQNRDGRVTAEECGIANDAIMSRRAPARRSLFAILDRNHDGQLSEAEIANAAAVLHGLDRNGDGSVGRAEIERTQ